MKKLYGVFFGLLLAAGVAAVAPDAAFANGARWDPACHCKRPAAHHITKRYVRDPVRVYTHKRIVNHTRVVKRTRVVQDKRVVVHVRPIIKREVIVHRQNTIVRNVTLHQVRTVNTVQNVYRHETVHRFVRGWTRVENGHRGGHHKKCRCGVETLVTSRD